MSRSVAALVYSRKCGSMARKAVLAYFAERANDDGSGIWASKQRIADEIECSKQTVIRVVKSLESDGLIKSVGTRKTQGGHTVIYDIDLSAVSKLGCAKVPIGEPEVTLNQSHHVTTKQSHSVTGTKSDQSHSVTPTSNTVLPKPSKNRPNNKKSRCAIPENWRPRPFGERSKSRGIVEAWTADTLEHQIEQFVANHRSKGNEFVDWQDAWSTWVLNSEKFKGFKNVGSKSNNGNSTRNAAQRALAAVEGRSY